MGEDIENRALREWYFAAKIKINTDIIIYDNMYRMFVMETPTPNWAELFLSNYGEFYPDFFTRHSLALELCLGKIWWP